MPMHEGHCNLCRIEMEHVSVRRGHSTLLSDIDLHIHCGELTALIGPNGAGKTTLLKALMGIVPHEGEIAHLRADGKPLRQVRVGYVPQRLDMDADTPLSVCDLVTAATGRFPVWLGATKGTRARARRVLAATECEDLLERRLGALSGGELQRVLLALAINPAPDLLVLDEPVSGVDQNGMQLFLDTVLRLRQTHHMAILLVSHDLHLVREYADHVVLLDKTVLCQGQPGVVFDSPEFERVFGTGEGAER